MAILFSGITE